MINIQKLKEQLIIDEGIRYKIYKDTKGNLTMGIGHLLTDWDPESWYIKTLPLSKIKITKERIEDLFNKDISIAIEGCKEIFSDFERFCEELQLILLNMMFNLGLSQFKKFIRFIPAIKNKDYLEAAKEMENSKWFKESKDRTIRLRNRMIALDHNMGIIP